LKKDKPEYFKYIRFLREMKGISIAPSDKERRMAKKKKVKKAEG
jgi:tRNA(Ser,Leu) C12 N-acetylase TAN1